MFIKKIELKKFRNYESLELNFSDKKSLIIGKNAQGKTNILEAVHYLSCLKSQRAKTDKEFILWGNDFAKIKAQIINQNIETELEVLINPPKRKELKINGIKKGKLSEFTSKLSVVNFSTSDLMLLRGAPDDRRDWLDIAISQIYPTYLDRYSKYNKIKSQKNNFLKSIKGDLNADKSLLDIYNLQMVSSGSAIIYIRLKFLQELQKIAKVKHKDISEEENLKITYDSNLFDSFDCSCDELLSVEQIAQKYEEKLSERMSEEIVRAQALAGPHRDDISYFINDKDAKKYASQGQQRTIVLSLKLAELEFIKDKIGASPILLLDDVLAELDDNRQNFLLNAINENTQTIITSVDTLQFNPEYLKNVRLYNISKGKLLD